MKKTVMVILAAILMLSVFAGCGKDNDEGNYCKGGELIDRFGELQKTMNVQEMVELTPPEYYEYYVNSLISSGECSSESEAKAEADIHFGSDNIFLLTPATKRLSIYDKWREDGYIRNVTTGFYWGDSDKEDVKELNSFLKNKFGFKKKVTAAEFFRIRYTIWGKDNDSIASPENLYGLAVKIDGTWYLVTDSEYWMTGDYDSPSAYVQWVYEQIMNYESIEG